MGSNAAKSSANAQVQAADKASATQLQMFDQTQQNIAPWLQGGVNGLNSLQNLYGIGPGGQGAGSPVLSALGIGPNGQPTGAGVNPTGFQGSPGFQFQKQQGIDAATNAAARTGGLGGNALKAITQFGTGLANTDWYNYLSSLNSGWNSLTGGLANLSGQGASAAGQLGNQSANVGNQVGQNTIGAGNAQASGIIGSANALTGGLNTALGGIGNAYQLYNSPGGLFPGLNGGGNGQGYVDNNSTFV